MSETIYTDEEIEILQQKIIEEIHKKCYNNKEFIEDDKLFLIENLKKYKIIACKIEFKIEHGMVNNWGSNGQQFSTHQNTYIHYINIHGDVYNNTIITELDNSRYESYRLTSKDFIDYPFYIYQEYETCRGNSSICHILSPKHNLNRKCNYDKYNYIYGTLNYIEKSFILSKYLLNLILQSNYIDYIDICKIENYHTQTNDIKKYMIKNLNYKNNIYIQFMKYIINKNDKNYNSLFYRTDDLEKIDDIDIIHKKEIDDYYDNIEKEQARVIQEELDRIAKEKQEELDRIAKEKQEELDRIAKEKQEELDRIAKEKQDMIDKENEIKRIARGNITIENNNITIENNTYEDLNLCDYLPFKTKKICDESGNIKNIRYTEITNITFINCKIIEITKYYTGITHLTFIKCNKFKTIPRYLKADLKYLKINNEILFDKN